MIFVIFKLVNFFVIVLVMKSNVKKILIILWLINRLEEFNILDNWMYMFFKLKLKKIVNGKIIFYLR